jgi:hypothetical protein
MWYRAIGLICLLLSAFGLPAQDTLFDKAPPAIDSALRARVKEFYDAHVEKRTVEIFDMVAKDSRQIFFDMEKPVMRSYEVKHVKYSDNFTKAVVLLSIDTDLVMLGFGRQKVIMPLQSTWKIVDGQWMWYVEPYDPEKGVKTPFGVMHKGKTGESDADPKQSVLAGMASAPTLEQIQSTVKQSAEKVELSSHQPSSAEVILTNTFAGKVQLGLEVEDLPGLNVRIDKLELEPGEQAKVTFDMKPQGTAKKPNREVRVRVSPTQQLIRIPVEFANPPLEATLKAK